MNILVTRPDNVSIGKNGEVYLKDEELIGHIITTHLVPIIKMNSENQPVQDMFASVAVCWLNKRSPAVIFEQSEDLYWLEQDDEEQTDLTTIDDDDDSDFDEEIDNDLNY
jgi:hypothetical protein